MQKVGELYLKSKQIKYLFVWKTNELDFERIDVFQDPKEYNPIDTSNCIAAYYRKFYEMVLGDEQVIQSIRVTIEHVLVAAGITSTDVTVKDGKVLLTQIKEDKATGIFYKMTLLGGKLESEYYEDADTVINIQSISYDRGIDMPPINLDSYSKFSIVQGVIADTGNSDYYSLSYLKSIYPLEHIEDNDFVVVSSKEEADARLLRFIKAPTKLKAIDIETTGTETFMFGSDVITGIVLSYSETESTYYPFRQDKCEFNLPISYIGKILDAINNQPKDTKILAYNAKFEKQGFWKENLYYVQYSPYIQYENNELVELSSYEMRLDVDVYILSVLINPIQQKGLHTLKGNVNKITGQFYLELENIFKNKKNIRFNVLPPEIIRYYACPDAPNTIKVYKHLINKLPESELGLLELESRLVQVKACNEFYGMRIDQKLLIKKIENEEYKVKMLGDMFRAIHHTTKNINSTDVRRDIFYNQLRCPIEVKTNKNQPSTSVVALKRILEIGTLRDYDKEKIPPDIKDLEGNVIIEGKSLISNKYPSLVILDQYAKAVKQLGAYKRIATHSIKGRVQFYINQVGAGSGRQTSDAHQYSDGMKELVLADSNDHWLWSADYKQVELRILAFLAGQKDLIELESDPCVDIHRAVLSIILGKEMWEITDKERKRGKTVNFGVVYGMSEFGLAKREHGPKYTEEELREAANAITSFYNGLPAVKNFVEGNKTFVEKHGYIATKMGRRRYFPQIKDPTITKRMKNSILKAANNTPVQGFGADLLKIVETNIQEYIHEREWDKLIECDGIMLPKVRLMLSIHDEVLLSSHKSIPIEEIIEMFKVCMEVEIKGAPPFFSAPALVKNWYEGKNDAYEIDLLFRDKILEAWKRDKTSLLHVDTYLEDLNKFRSERLNKYMDDLIQKYKTVEEVSKHIRHPELTHTLIKVYLKKDNKNFTHEEAIIEATRRYMENNKQEIEEYSNLKKEEAIDEKYAKDSIQDPLDLSKYVHVDENGELIIENSNEYEEEEEQDDTEISTTEKFEIQQVYVQFTLNEAIIDLSNYNSLILAEPINQAIAKLHNPKAHYTVVYLFKGRCLSSKIKVEYNDKKKVIEIIKEYEDKFECRKN